MKQQVKISKVKGNPSNPRIIKNDKFKKLVKSIQEFPEMLKLRPIVVDEDMMVLGGNMRLKASKEAGLSEVWIDIAEGLTEEQKKEFIVKDNVGFGEWEWDILANEWDSVQLAEWGLDVWENEDDKISEAGLIEDDEIPEVKESIVKRGDIWQLGEHRVMCGDSTSSDDVAKLMNGEKADMVFTDPPYGMFLDTDYTKMTSSKSYTSSNKHSVVIGDHQDFKPEFISIIFKEFEYCKEIFIWGADYFAEYIEDKNKGSWVVWDKRANDTDDIEKDESSDKMYGSCFELCWSKNRHKRDIARIKWAGIFGMGGEDTKSRIHPTQKPSLLAEWFFNKWGKENDLIADIFLGSGSTLIAAEKLNRKCYGMELDEKYCDVIINRWEQFTGLKAKKI
jgi:DNA modification methylase